MNVEFERFKSEIEIFHSHHFQFEQVYQNNFQIDWNYSL